MVNDIVSDLLDGRDIFKILVSKTMLSTWWNLFHPCNKKEYKRQWRGMGDKDRNLVSPNADALKAILKKTANNNKRQQLTAITRQHVYLSQF